MDRIIVCDTKEQAYATSERMYDEDCEAKSCPTPKAERATKYKYGVEENVLSAQYGLHVPSPDWDTLDRKYWKNVQVKNPLWIDEKFLNGDPFFAIGHTPLGFGFGVVDPAKVRGILEGNYSRDLIEEVRGSGRKYTVEVHDLAKDAILDMQKDPVFQRHLLSSMDPYRFEELVAELLRGQGFEVFLTKRSRDGGRDIIAAFYEDGTEYLMMVDCKRKSDHITLGPENVRALLGQYYVETITGSGFNCAMLVTSAGGFGPSSLKLQEQVYELSLKSRKEISEWITDYGRFYNGLWVPKKFKELFSE